MGRMQRAQGMFPGCSLPSDGLGQPLGQDKMRLLKVWVDLSGCAAQMASENLPKARLTLAAFCLLGRLVDGSCSSQGIAMQPAKCQSTTK